MDRHEFPGAAFDRWLTHDPREDQPECEGDCEDECTCFDDMDDERDPDDERDERLDWEANEDRYVDCYD